MGRAPPPSTLRITEETKANPFRGRLKTNSSIPLQVGDRYRSTIRWLNVCLLSPGSFLTNSTSVYTTRTEIPQNFHIVINTCAYILTFIELSFIQASTPEWMVTAGKSSVVFTRGAITAEMFIKTAICDGSDPAQSSALRFTK